MNSRNSRLVLLLGTLLSATAFPACKRDKPAATPPPSDQPTATVPGASGERSDTSVTDLAATAARESAEKAESAAKEATSAAEAAKKEAETAASVVTDAATGAAAGAKEAVGEATTAVTDTAKSAAAGAKEAVGESTTATIDTATKAAEETATIVTPAPDKRTIELSTLTEEQVRNLQAALRQQGASIQVDGVIGPKTHQALKDFQSSHNLGASGAIDTTTLSGLGLKAEDFMPAH